jgi:hypothetical protein
MRIPAATDEHCHDEQRRIPLPRYSSRRIPLPAYSSTPAEYPSQVTRRRLRVRMPSVRTATILISDRPRRGIIRLEGPVRLLVRTRFVPEPPVEDALGINLGTELRNGVENGVEGQGISSTTGMTMSWLTIRPFSGGCERERSDRDARPHVHKARPFAATRDTDRQKVSVPVVETTSIASSNRSWRLATATNSLASFSMLAPSAQRSSTRSAAARKRRPLQRAVGWDRRATPVPSALPPKV